MRTNARWWVTFGVCAVLFGAGVSWIIGARISGLGEHGSRAAPDNSPEAGYQLRERPCEMKTSWRKPIRCAELLTPQYHTAAGPQRFRLPVVILPSQAPQRRGDPVIYLPGGPGGSPGLDVDSIEFWQSWQEYSNLRRDLILMDRRGV